MAEVLGLTMADSGQLEIRPAFCFEALADLRERCYEHGLSVNAGFTGDED